MTMTTIDAGALKGDLAERLLTIELNLIPDVKRREEAEIDAAYADAHACILASLFDLLAQVLKALPDVQLTERPRMADFARVLAAVDTVKGWAALATYKATAQAAVTDALEGDPFGSAIAAFARGRGTWTGTATQLLAAITPDKPPKSWPKDATRAGGQLKRLAPLLRSVGIDVAETRTTTARQFVFVAKDRSCKTASSASSASCTPPDLGKRHDASYDADDAETRLASSASCPASYDQMAADLRECQHHDADDADDAEMQPLSGHANGATDDSCARSRPPEFADVPADEIGQCAALCGRSIRRYGPHATGTLCAACQAKRTTGGAA